jgi:hypothetical protein
MNHQLLYSLHHRPRRYNYNSVLNHYLRSHDGPKFDPENAFKSFFHRIHSHHCDRDDDSDVYGHDETDNDAGNVMPAGDKSAGELMGDFIKRNRARLGLPAPKGY